MNSLNMCKAVVLVVKTGSVTSNSMRKKRKPESILLLVFQHFAMNLTRGAGGADIFLDSERSKRICIQKSKKNER